MDFESQLESLLRLDIIYERQFLINTVMSAIDNDPYIEEVSKARIRTLPIPDSERGGFATWLGRFIVRQLLRIRPHTDEDVTRDVVRYLTTVPYPLGEFFAYFNLYVYKGCECEEWFTSRESRRYVPFLITVCEFCCKIVDMDEFLIYFNMVLQWADFYMIFFRKANNLKHKELAHKLYNEEITNEELTEEELTDEELIDKELTEEELTDEELTDEELTDEELTDVELTDEELTDEELTDEELTDEELTDEELTDEKLTDEELTDEEFTHEELTDEELIADEPIYEEYTDSEEEDL